MLDQLSERAVGEARLRAHLVLHERADAPQRLIIAIEPGSYVRPHVHPVSESWSGDESLVVLRGSAAVLLFDQRGAVVDRVRLECGEAYQIPGGKGHSVVALTPRCVLYEVKPGNRPDPDRLWLPGTLEDSQVSAARAQARDWVRECLEVSVSEG
jgi:cupin fold WbuC family metalloprotein